MRCLERSVMIIVGLILFFEADSLRAHEFETGHIERSIDVIIRDHKIEVKYSVGLADETIVNWLVAENAIEAADEARFRKSIAEYEAASATKEKTKTGSSGSSGSAGSVTPSRDSEQLQPQKFQTELTEVMKEKLAPLMLEKLVLATGESQLKVDAHEVSASPRHHVALQIVLRATLPKVGPTKLSITDGNFLETKEADTEDKPAIKEADEKESDKEKAVFRYFGNIRLACRVKGDAIQLNSNVAKVLARAQPVALGQLELEQRVRASTISTKIGFAKSTKR